MLVLKRLIATAATGAAFLAGAGAAFAQTGGPPTGQPHPWQLGLQHPATPVMDDIVGFHNELLVIITLITAFVLALLVVVMVKFNARANPHPSRTTHNTVLEMLWTVVPVAILVIIAIPSFKLLFFEQDIPHADLTVKATGKQWFWTYTYPDSGNFEFDSLLARDKQPRLLAVENPNCGDIKYCGELVVPVNKVVHVLTTGADVIHSFAMPSFGIKIDAVPGRINETWFRAEREGVFYGQCSELCGKDHAFMPIAIRVVPEAEFTAWLGNAKKQFARLDDARPTALAAAETATVK